MKAQVASTADGSVRVWCLDELCPRPLDWTVATLLHAQNLAAKHDRENHPDDAPAVPGEAPAAVLEVNLTAAAEAVTHAQDWADRWPGIRAGEAAGVALGVWCALIGVEDYPAALSLARQLAATRTPVTAAVPPF